MKTLRDASLVLTFAFCFTAVSAATDSVPSFNAVLAVGTDSRFVLVDATQHPSSFLRLGDKFNGYTLKTYDAKGKVLELERDGKIVRVVLVPDAEVKDGASKIYRLKLEAAAKKISPMGVVAMGKTNYLIVDKKRVPAGGKISVKDDNEEYEFEVVRADRTSFVVQCGGEEFTLPMKKRGETNPPTPSPVR